jgi:hypothetical protein
LSKTHRPGPDMIIGMLAVAVRDSDTTQIGRRAGVGR